MLNRFGVLALCLLTLSVPGKTQSDAPTVRWDAMESAGQDLKQSLVKGDGRSAHMRVIYMELLLAGSSHAPVVAEQLATMEARPIPQENDPSLTRFLPVVDDLLQAIGESDPVLVNSRLRALSTEIGDERVALAKRNSSMLTPDANGSVILGLRRNLEHALYANDTAKSVALATEMQGLIDSLLSKHQFVDEYALNNYIANDALGRAAYLTGDYKLACDYLQKAADVPIGANGTVMLDYFGPNMWLAEHLLHVGKNAEVLKFLRTFVDHIWLHDTDKAGPWIAALQSGRYPDLQPNSSAGYGYLPQ